MLEHDFLLRTNHLTSINRTQLADLQALVIDGIKAFLISSVIQTGVEWLLGLLTPAGAFIKAAIGRRSYRVGFCQWQN